MGYQESWLTSKKAEEFDGMVEAMRGLGREYWADKFVSLVAIVTLKEDVSEDFPAGKKLIYVTGERQYQRDPSGRELLGEALPAGGVSVLFTENVSHPDKGCDLAEALFKEVTDKEPVDGAVEGTMSRLEIFWPEDIA